MVDKKILENLSKESVAEIGSDTLADLLDVTIEGETPAQRLESYLAQVGDPYLFRVGNTPVRLLFHDEEKPLSIKLKSYFMKLKNSGI